MQRAKFKLRKSDNLVSSRNQPQREGGKGKWDGRAGTQMRRKLSINHL